VLRDYAEFYLSGPDEMAADGMRTYAAGFHGDPVIISGESGAATLGAAQRILEEPAFIAVREAMGLNKKSVLLFINTEGDTDPENYRRIVAPV
jgi:diaminopropionate ammonia-lyase